MYWYQVIFLSLIACSSSNQIYREIILLSINGTVVQSTTIIKETPYFDTLSTDSEVFPMEVSLLGLNRYVFNVVASNSRNEKQQLSKFSVESPITEDAIQRQIYLYCRMYELTSQTCNLFKEHVMKCLKKDDQIIFHSELQRRENCPAAAKPFSTSAFNPGPQPSCRRNGLKIAIVHLATENAHWSASHVQATNLFYARRHGYDFISHSCPTHTDKIHMWDPNDQIRANWAKPSIILEYLQKYHYVVFLDSDSQINDPSRTVEEMVGLHMDENFSIILPNNCLGEDAPDRSNGHVAMKCWTDGVNIGVIVAKSNSATVQIMKEWEEAVYGDCSHLAAPQYEGDWGCNDQGCLDLLYSERPHFKKHINKLGDHDTYFFSGGARDGWILQYFTSSKNRARIGFEVQKRAISVMTQKSFEYLEQRQPYSWVKVSKPVFGGLDRSLGKIFDVCVLFRTVKLPPTEMKPTFCMYFSWTSLNSIGLTFSYDGMTWGDPAVALYGQNDGIGNDWQSIVNRPHVLYHNSIYHMWYSAQDIENSVSTIGYATSPDGLKWERHIVGPVLAPTQPWEHTTIMCSHVLFDAHKSLYRMWYSAGHQYEPLAIGHAVSCDGIHWNRTQDLPIFTSDRMLEWEQDRVTCPTVVYNGEYYYMFYIGFANIDDAAIGIARSRDGVSNWERHPHNPILKPSAGSWDRDAVYKPYPVFDGSRWWLWYNGRHGIMEQIGLAILFEHDLFKTT